MCGIVGVATGSQNGLTVDEANAFRDMLVMDTLRGWDSTGVFGVDKHKNVLIMKEATHGADFVRTSDYAEFHREIVRNGMFVVGHNRAATKGSVKDANAHPFWVDDRIVLVQNGTYKGDHRHHKNTEVDTEAVAHVIAENPNTEEALQKINAAYALVWFDADKGTLNIIRNTERPLWVLYTKSPSSLFFASEPGILVAACERNNIKMSDEPYQLKPGHLYSMQIKGSKWEGKGEDLDIAFRFPKSAQTQAHNPSAACAWWDGQGEYEGLHTSGWRQTNKGIFTRHGFYDDGDGDSVSDATVIETTARNVIPTSATPIGRPEDLTITFAEVVQQLRGVERSAISYIDPKNVSKVAEKFLTDHAGQRTIPVELVDCVPANNHPMCTRWHVYGYEINPEGKIGADEAVMLHWYITNKSKAEAIDYVCSGIFTVQPGSVVTRHMTIDSENVSIATCMASNPILIPTATEAKVEHVH